MRILIANIDASAHRQDRLKSLILLLRVGDIGRGGFRAFFPADFALRISLSGLDMRSKKRANIVRQAQGSDCRLFVILAQLRAQHRRVL